MAWVAGLVIAAAVSLVAAELGSRWWMRRYSGYRVWPPGARIAIPMLPMTIHIVTTDIEEERNKASPVHRRRRAAFDSRREPNQDANQ